MATAMAAFVVSVWSYSIKSLQKTAVDDLDELEEERKRRMKVINVHQSGNYTVREQGVGSEK